MLALRGTSLLFFRRNAANPLRSSSSRLSAECLRVCSAPCLPLELQPRPSQQAYCSRQQATALSTLRRGLTGPRSAKARLPMRGLEEFLEPVKLRPDEKHVTGRSWTVQELRNKSFEELHKLWFVLYKERNMIVTERMIAHQARTRFPQLDRREKVKRSMKAIKVVVGERQRVKQVLLKERQEAEKLETELARRDEKVAEKAKRMEAHAERVAQNAE